ncbi:putative reverse transcriptase zinc-binding domain-containing protein [Helianthus anomalus]
MEILEFRSILRSHIIHKIGNGQETSAWFDNWHTMGPLSNLLTHRNMSENPFTRFAKVSDLIHGDQWRWPQDWQHRFPALFQSPCIPLNPQARDKIFWKTNEGELIDFNVRSVWSDIQETGQEVPCVDLVWFSQNIPRQAFILWLAMKNRLQTHEIIGVWQGVGDLKCISLLGFGSKRVGTGC